MLLKKLLKQKNKTAKNSLNHRMRHLITASFHPVVCPGYIQPYSCSEKWITLSSAKLSFHRRIAAGTRPDTYIIHCMIVIYWVDI